MIFSLNIFNYVKMTKKSLVVILYTLLISCSKNNNELQSYKDPIIGVWKLDKYLGDFSFDVNPDCVKNNTLTVHDDLTFDLRTYKVDYQGNCVEKASNKGDINKKDANLYEGRRAEMILLDNSTLKIQPSPIWFMIFKKQN